LPIPTIPRNIELGLFTHQQTPFHSFNMLPVQSGIDDFSLGYEREAMIRE